MSKIWSAAVADWRDDRPIEFPQGTEAFTLRLCSPEGRVYEITARQNSNGIEISSAYELSVRPRAANIVEVYDAMHRFEPVAFVHGVGYVGGLKPDYSQAIVSSLPEDTHLVCPYCGAKEVAQELHDWPSFSEEDPDNKAVLQEHQCRDCSRSFWT